MAVLVDPPPHDNAGNASAGTVTTPTPPAVTGPAAQQPVTKQPTPPQTTPKLAEPPLTGGKVEELMGRLIKVLAHSPLARPLPAVVLSVLGLAGVAFVGLCATAPDPSNSTPPVLLPVTNLARQIGMPHLGSDLSSYIMYTSIGLCCLGLAMMLWANSHLGWSPSPYKVFAASAVALAVLVGITPVGSATSPATRPTGGSPRSAGTRIRSCRSNCPAGRTTRTWRSSTRCGGIPRRSTAPSRAGSRPSPPSSAASGRG
jgi:hypothetical protein